MSRKIFFLFFCVIVTGLARVWAQTKGCEVPKDMKKDQKLPCIRTASIILAQPTLTPEQLANGPDFDSADPEKSHFGYFTGNDTISCYFRPHYAFVAVPGDSMKFQCWHMTPDGAFYGKKGELIRVDDVKVVVEKDNSGERSASLYARNDDKNEHEIKPDRFKIKYLKPAYPDHNPRFNEVFTTEAASRIMWVLGFPADHVYPAAAVSCIGCGSDPFGNKLADNNASLKDAPTSFKIVSAERELPWDESIPRMMKRGPGLIPRSF